MKSKYILIFLIMMILVLFQNIFKFEYFFKMLPVSLKHFPAGAPRSFSFLRSTALGPVSEPPVTCEELSPRALQISRWPLPRNPPSFHRKKNEVFSPVSFYWRIPENTGLLSSAAKAELSPRLFRITGSPSVSFCPLFPLGFTPEGHWKPPMTHLFNHVSGAPVEG